MAKNQAERRTDKIGCGVVLKTSKRLQIKSLYILSLSDHSYFNTLHGHLNSFKKFIYTKKELPEAYQETNKNFYKFMNNLALLSSKNQKECISTLEKVKQCNMLAEKQWMIQQVERFIV